MRRSGSVRRPTDPAGLEQGSLSELVAAAIRGVPEEYQELMWGNVVLVGGTAGAKGLRRRLYVNATHAVPMSYGCWRLQTYPWTCASLPTP